MREFWSGLTVRGSCLIAAGVALALTGITMGEQGLVRISVLAVAAPVVSSLFVGRNRFRLSSARSTNPVRTAVDEPASVELRLTNRSSGHSGVLRLEDNVSHVLGAPARFVLDRLAAGQSATLTYEVSSPLRGRFALGPLTLQLSDAFGLVRRSRSFTATDVLTVVPVVHPLPQVGLGGAYSTGGESSARSVSIQGEDDAATREYRDGDDLRKVHWRSTARTGTMMVRREEQPWQTRSALLLDTRAVAHRGSGRRSSFEWSVSAAASVGDHLGRMGYSMRLFTDTGEIAGVSGLAGRERLADQLAVVRTSTLTTLDHGVGELRQASEDGLLVCVLGRAGPDDAAALIRGRPSTSTSIAVLADTATFDRERPADGSYTPPSPEVAATAEVFRRAGWRVVVVAAGITITEAWMQAGVTAFGYSGTAAEPGSAQGTRMISATPGSGPR